MVTTALPSSTVEFAEIIVRERVETNFHGHKLAFVVHAGQPHAVGLQRLAVTINHTAISQVKLHLVNWASHICTFVGPAFIIHLHQVLNIANLPFAKVAALVGTPGVRCKDFATKPKKGELPALDNGRDTRLLLHAEQGLRMSGA